MQDGTEGGDDAGPDHLWMDSHLLAGPFKAVFEKLANLFGVKEDVLHVMMRYVALLPKDWPLKGVCWHGATVSAGMHVQMYSVV